MLTHGLNVCCVSQAAGYDVVTMDTETGRKATRDALAEAARAAGREPAVVQGNFDPRLLTDDSSMSEVNVSVSCLIASGRLVLCANLRLHTHPRYILSYHVMSCHVFGWGGRVLEWIVPPQQKNVLQTLALAQSNRNGISCGLFRYVSVRYLPICHPLSFPFRGRSARPRQQ